MIRLIFATNIRNSGLCWEKMLMAGELHRADVLILGGDLLGSGLQCIVQDREGVWSTRIGHRIHQASDLPGLHRLEEHLCSMGLYPYRTTEEELLEMENSPEFAKTLFRQEASRTLATWFERAEESLRPTRRHLYILPGSNDPLFLEQDVTPGSELIAWLRDRVVQLDRGNQLIGESTSPSTTIHGPREMDEDKLLQTLEQRIRLLEDVYSAVFCFHSPPYDSGLDHAPVLKGNSPALVPTGSRAVRRIIETHQPMLSLHGQTRHPARRFAHIGRTLCLNPGASCSEGVLAAMLVVLGRTGIRSFQTLLG